MSGYYPSGPPAPGWNYVAPPAYSTANTYPSTPPYTPNPPPGGYTPAQVPAYDPNPPGAYYAPSQGFAPQPYPAYGGGYPTSDAPPPAQSFGSEGSGYSSYPSQPTYVGASGATYGPSSSYEDKYEQKSSGQGGGNFMKGIGNFAGKNKLAIGSAALSYKMGGTLGKVLAAGTAADLANRYSKEKKYEQHNQPSGYSSGGAGSHKPSKGLTGDLLHTGQNLLGKATFTVGKFVGGGGKSVKELQTGNVVQLISQANGRALQIVKAPDGRLVLDAKGNQGPQAFNAHFTVIRESDNIVLLNNNGNFVCLANDQIILYPSSQPTAWCRWVIREDHSSRSVALVASCDPGACLGVDQEGRVLPPRSIRPNTFNSNFAVQLINSPHSPRGY